MVLASSAIPFGLDPVEIDGAHFVDGGWEAMGGDNTPAAPILENHPEIRTLVVVHLNAEAAAEGPWRRPTRLPALLGGVRYVEIRPSVPLPGVCDGLALGLELLPDDLARETAPLARLLRRAGGVFAFDPVSVARSLARARPRRRPPHPRRQPRSLPMIRRSRRSVRTSACSRRPRVFPTFRLPGVS